MATPQASRCMLCFDEFEAGVEDAGAVWLCDQDPEAHRCCGGCIQAYLTSQLADRRVLEFRCPMPECSAVIDDVAQLVFMSRAQLDEIAKRRRLASDSSLRECPRCEHLVARRSRASLRMQCPSCAVEFCFDHGMINLTLLYP
jgi:hypothetical protein